MKLKSLILVFLIGCVAFSHATGEPPAKFFPVYFPDYLTPRTLADISGDGTTVTGTLVNLQDGGDLSDYRNPQIGFHLTRSGDLSVIANPYISDSYGASPYKLSYDGAVVVGDQRGNGLAYGAFYWTKEAGTQWHENRFKATTRGYYSLSADGSLILSRQDLVMSLGDDIGEYGLYTPEGVRLYPGTRFDFGISGVSTPDESKGYTSNIGINNLLDMSANGTKVVGSTHDGSSVYWTKETGVVPLLQPSGFEYIYADSISADGSVLGGTIGNAPGIWIQDTETKIINLLDGAVHGVVSDLSKDGAVVVGKNTFESRVQESFVWTEEQGEKSLQNLLIEQGLTELKDWSFLWSTDQENTGFLSPSISDDGNWVSGFAAAPDGKVVAYFANIDPNFTSNNVQPIYIDATLLPVPEPSTWTMYILALLGFYSWGRFRRSVDQGQST